MERTHLNTKVRSTNGNPDWKRGMVGSNPAGRPKGKMAGGRKQTLHLLDELVGQPKNLEKIRRSLQHELDKDPFLFWRNVVVPLMPRDVIDRDTSDEAGTVTTDNLLLSMFRSMAPVVVRKCLNLKEDEE